MLQLLYLWHKNRQYPHNNRLGGYWKYFRHFQEEKYFLLPHRIEPQILQPLAQSVGWMWGGTVQMVKRLAMGWAVWGSNPGGGEIFPTQPDWPWPKQPAVQGVPLSFPGVKQLRLDTDHPPHLLPRLKQEWSDTCIPCLGLHGLF
jgi:hypothetical protein